MEYRRLGKSGLKVSEFSFGSWVTFGKQVNGGDAVDLMKLAYDNGINFFDNAEGLPRRQSQKSVMGEALKSLAWSRDSYVVSSKVFWGGQKPTQRGLSRRAWDGRLPRSAQETTGSTISTSTSAIARILTLRSRKRCARCTISSPRARFSTGERRNGPHSS